MRFTLIGIITLSLLLSGCTAKKTPPLPEVDLNLRRESLMRKNLQYTKELSDAAIAYYLDKEYDEEYAGALRFLPKHIDLFEIDTRTSIPLDNAAYVRVMEEYNKVTEVVAIISGNENMFEKEYEVKPWTTMTNTEMAQAYKAGEFELPEDIIQELLKYELLETSDIRSIAAPEVDASKIDKVIQETYFPDGVYPDIPLFNDVNAPTSEFKHWFIQKIKDLGYLDRRVQLVDNRYFEVNVEDLTARAGGLTFKVFDEEYTVEYEGNTLPNLDSPVYDMVLHKYISYPEAGFYQADYISAPGVEAPITIQVQIYYQNAINFSDYLGGVLDVGVALVGGNE